MRGFIEKFIRRFFPWYGKLKSKVKLVRFFLRQDLNYVLPLLTHFQTTMGGINSFQQKKPLDSNNDPLPWYTYPAIEFLYQFDFSNCDIFEFGSGNSSLFWGKRAKTVISVESDREWFDSVKNKISENQKILFASDKMDYVHSIQASNQVFDIVIVDGMWRGLCTVEAVKSMKPGGFIIFDNLDWYPASSKFLRENGFLQIDFVGFGPVNTIAWCTSIFLKGDCCIPRRSDVDTVQVLDGIVQLAPDDTF